MKKSQSRTTFTPQFLKISKLMKMKTVPKYPFIPTFTNQQWKNITRGMKNTKKAIPKNAIRITAFKIPKPFSGFGDIAIIGNCSSIGPGERCIMLEKTTLGKGISFRACHCTKEDDIESPTPPEIPTTGCEWIINDRLAACIGTCASGNNCGLVRSGNIISCSCFLTHIS